MKGHVTPIKWTDKQREIYHRMVTEGQTFEEVHEAGYGTENITRVSQAIGRGESPPGYDPSEPSLRAPAGAKPAEETGKEKGNGHKTAPPAATVEHSVSTIVRSQEARIYSTLLWQAKQAAIKVFGWPANMSDSMFLDKWLKKSFAAYGVHIGDFWVEPAVKIAQPDGQEEEESDQGG